MGIASQSGSVLVLGRSGYDMSSWGLFGYGEHYSGGGNGAISFAYRLAFTTDALGGSALRFSVSGVGTRVWDSFYASWMSVNASGQSVSAEAMTPYYYLSASPAYDANAARSRAVCGGGGYSGSLSVRLSPNSTYYLYLLAPGAGAASGTPSLSVTGSYGTAASVSAPDGYFGEALPVTLSGGGAGASYTVTVSCAGRSETLQSRGTATRLSWTPDPALYAAALPNASSAAATITCESFYAGASVGSRSLSVTLRFRAGSLPPALSPGWYTLSAYNSGAAAGMSGYIAGFSRAEASFDPSKIAWLHGASVASYSLSAAGETVSAAPYRSGVLTGDTPLTLTVTDSRGQTASETVTLTPLAYAAPALRNPALWRADAQGAADEAGRYFAARSGVTYSALSGQNTLTLSCAWRFPGGSWSAETAMQPDTLTVVAGLDPDRSYELRIRAVDALGGEALWTAAIPSQKWAMKFRPDGEGLAFGMAAEQGKCLQIPEDWSFRRGSRPQPVETYAVGDLYLTTRAGDPAALLGYGTWERIEGRFLLAASADWPAGSSGGEAAHTLSESELPAHRHTLHDVGVGPGTGTASYGGVRLDQVLAHNDSSAVGGGQAHNNMPPYLAVYIWKRTA